MRTQKNISHSHHATRAEQNSAKRIAFFNWRKSLKGKKRKRDPFVERWQQQTGGERAWPRIIKSRAQADNGEGVKGNSLRPINQVS